MQQAPHIIHVFVSFAFRLPECRYTPSHRVDARTASTQGEGGGGEWRVGGYRRGTWGRGRGRDTRLVLHREKARTSSTQGVGGGEGEACMGGKREGGSGGGERAASSFRLRYLILIQQGAASIRLDTATPPARPTPPALPPPPSPTTSSNNKHLPLHVSHQAHRTPPTTINTPLHRSLGVFSEPFFRQSAGNSAKRPAMRRL